MILKSLFFTSLLLSESMAIQINIAVNMAAIPNISSAKSI